MRFIAAVFLLLLLLPALARADLSAEGKAGNNCKDDQTAVLHWQPLADRGDPHAMWEISRLYFLGWGGLKQDFAESERWTRKAAEQGDLNALRLCIVIYADGRHVKKDPAEAMRWYRIATQRDDPDTQSMLGFLNYNGDGVKQDYEEAAKWFRKAAEGGNSQAQHMLGYMYESGKGVKKDPVQAVKWFRKAADQGNEIAQRYLGHMYKDGEGVTRDYQEAYFWLCLVPEFDQDMPPSGFVPETLRYFYRLFGILHYQMSNDDTMLVSARDQTLVHLTREQRTAVEKRVAEWRADISQIVKSANTEDCDAQVRLGYLYSEGKGVKQDYLESYYWYSLATRPETSCHEFYIDHLDSVAKKLTNEQKAAIDKRVQEWKSTPAQPAAPLTKK